MRTREVEGDKEFTELVVEACDEVSFEVEANHKPSYDEDPWFHHVL